MEELMHFRAKSAAIARNATIHDPRKHSPEVLERLRQAVVSDAPAVPESNRPGFYEIYADECVFYIHLSPITKDVTLLAIWSCEPEFEAVQSA
jgi:hypothetical protein